ncbi:uncharacterized protein CcaverHIS019_0404480 [Cutaneotrichosporon cavernicola]|uniref:Piwi-domain-containing protein n=1 Tax=Cutaneotrichosporon cavernicola TaxID=279322 RepID=A0AA48L476_9TREE|nr:uncharacterized protein CcaverHIS019_0404480 [Cutaneotrichosporon cavernicola]BEI91628.1 hypothetical protein CcaverHIS019_0404480 [Cutaneotrichosporon cavernicola]
MSQNNNRNNGLGHPPQSWGRPHRERDPRDEYLPRHRRQEEDSPPTHVNRNGGQCASHEDHHQERHDYNYQRRQHDQYDLSREREGRVHPPGQTHSYNAPQHEPTTSVSPFLGHLDTAPLLSNPFPSLSEISPPRAPPPRSQHVAPEHLLSRAPADSPSSQFDDDTRPHTPLRSELSYPGPSPHPGRQSYAHRPVPPASPMSPGLLPPHLRPHEGVPHERPRYTPSPLSREGGQYTSGQFDDANDLSAVTGRMSLASSPTLPPPSPVLKNVSATHTGMTDRNNLTTRTEAITSSKQTTESYPSSGRPQQGSSIITVSTPGTESRRNSKPVHITEELEAMPLTSFYVRPGYGKDGRALTVESNYFAVRAIGGRGKIIHHYDVAIEPVVRTSSQKFPRTLLRSVWEQLALQSENRPEWHSAFAAAAFDGRRNAYSPIPFPVADGEKITLTVSLASTREVARQQVTSSDDEFRRFRVTFRKAAEIDLEAVMRFCRADSSETRDHNAEEACLTGVMATNILLRDVPSKTYTQVGATGQKFYTLEGARPLPHGTVVLNGFMQSFRYSNSGFPLLNIDLGFSAFLMSGPCLDVVAKILGPGPARLRGGPRGHPQQTPVFHSLDQMQIAILKRKLRGARFTVTHRPSPRLHTVITVTSLPAQEIKFTVEGKDGQPERKLNVAQYYHEYYASRLQFPGLPCIQVILLSSNVLTFQYGKRAFVPLEFVKIEDFNSLPPTNLSPDQIAEMIKHSAMRPPERKATILKWRERLAHETQPKIAKWGLQVNRSMVQLDARVLNPPEVKYGGHRTMRPQAGSWNLRNLTFFREGLRPLTNWAVVSFERYTDEDTMKRWVMFLVQRLRQLGVKVDNPTPKLIPPLDPRQPDVITNQLKVAARAAYRVNNQVPQLICCILPGKEAWLYEQIKRIAFTDLNVATQCMQAAKIKNDRGLLAYTDNLCMKIVQKLGGLSHQVNIKDMPGMIHGKTMILGADLGHPPFRPDSKEPTVACSVATYNADCDAYSAQIRLQEGRSEIIVDLSSMIEEHLRIFAKENKSEFPERILVFRDGISEGQYAAALHYEHNAIVEACERVLKRYRPRILVCVCARRHNTRFFAKNMQDADRSGNLPAGLVVDKSVTHPYAFDFFLQAHSGLVGTARPTHYICLVDELGTTPDQLQKLCNALSYSFARCTKSVSLVPVCYMADLVIKKARLIVQSNEGTVSPSEYSGSRAPSLYRGPQSRYGGAAPSVIGSEATTLRRQRFEERHDIMHIQKILAKNEELSRVAWWM